MSPSYDQIIQDGTSAHSLYPENRPSIPDDVLPSVGPDSMPAELPSEGGAGADKFKDMTTDSLVSIEICDMVTRRKQSVIDFRREKKVTWDKCWDHLKNVYDTTGKEEWQSVIFQPETVKVVETIASNLHATALGPDVPIEWQCKVKEYEQMVRDVNDIQRNDFGKSKAKVHYTDIIRSIVAVGTGIGKVGYKKRKDIVMVKNRGRIPFAARAMALVTGQQLPPALDTYTPQEVLVEDWATIEYRDLYKIYPEPGSIDVDREHWIIEEDEVSNAELVALSKEKDEVLKIKTIPADILSSGKGGSDQTDPEQQSRRLALQQGYSVPFYFDPDRKHERLEYWGPVPIWMIVPETRGNPDYQYETVNAWIWVIDGRWVARAQLMPYRDAIPPYFKTNYIRVPGDFYGIGAAELMLGLQIDLNETVNTGSDQVNLSLNKIVAVLKDKVPVDAWNRLVSKPGAQWLFENAQRIGDVMQIVEFPPINRDWYMKIQMIQQAIAEVTAANKVMLGVGGGQDTAGGSTFRGQMLNIQTSNERFMLYARVFETTGLADAYRRQYQRIYQFKDYEAVDYILGKERGQKFEFIPPEILEQVANLVPQGVLAAETKGVKLAQKAQWVQLFGQFPWAKTYEVARSMWVDMGNPDPDTATFSDEEMNQFNEFRKQVMMEQVSGAPPGSPPSGPSVPTPGGASQPPAPGGMPVAGNVPGPTEGMPRPPLPARGPGASTMDVTGRPLS